jgi:hypothetical protein
MYPLTHIHAKKKMEGGQVVGKGSWKRWCLVDRLFFLVQNGKIKNTI